MASGGAQPGPPEEGFISTHRRRGRWHLTAGAFKILGASRRPPTPNFRFFRFFGVFGPFSEFFVVGEGAGGSGDLFSCSGIDFSCSGVEFSCSESIFRARRSISDPGRWFFLCFRLVFWIFQGRGGPGSSGDPFSCSGLWNRFFMLGSRIFMLKIDCSCSETDVCPQKMVFLRFSACFRGRGGSGRVRGLIFLFRN